MATTGRATYWHRHPRDFANECEIVRCTSEAQEIEAFGAGYRNLSVAEVREHVRWINGENESWGNGRAVGHISITQILDKSDPTYAFRG